MKKLIKSIFAVVLVANSVAFAETEEAGLPRTEEEVHGKSNCETDDSGITWCRISVEDGYGGE